jgi:hypothetical protein
MITTAKQIRGCQVCSTDVPVGRVEDILFDDRTWLLRNLVVRIGNLFHRRRVLIGLGQVLRADWPARRVDLGISITQVHAAPPLESDPPVAVRRQREDAKYLAWDAYWAGVFDGPADPGDPNLQSTYATTGHRVEGADKDSGRIENFVVDDREWRIRYLIVGVRRGIHPRHVLIAPTWVESISWDEHKVRLTVPRVLVEHSPEFHGIGQLMSNS